MVTKKIISQEKAIEIIHQFGAESLFELARQNDGVLWLDLVRGTCPKNNSGIALKLIVLSDLRDYVPHPKDKMIKSKGLSERERVKIEEEIEEEKEQLEEMDKEELVEIGHSELIAWACIHEKELMAEIENKIKDFYLVHKLFGDKKSR
jgi:hypothetical protein